MDRMKSRACTRTPEAWSSSSRPGISASPMKMARHKKVFAKPGEARWFPPFKHRVENLGETSYSAVYIGIKNKRLANEAGLKSGASEMQMQMDEQTRKLVAEALLAAMK